LEVNESKLIENEVRLRNLRLTQEVTETRRSMVRWLALALGIINPGESRLSAVCVFDSMLFYQFSLGKDPTVTELSEYISKNWEPINEKTLRYHLLQLKNANLISHSKGQYFFVQHAGEKYNIDNWLEGYFETEISPIKDKISTVIKELKKR